MPTVTAPTRIALKNILLATDFLPCSLATLPYALGLARRYGSTLYLVNVLPHTPFVETAQPDPKQAREAAESSLANLIKSEALKGIKHQELIEQGEIPQVLSGLVRKHGVDLIVIGTCGRKGLGKLLLGSVAEEVFRTAECPVLTVGPHVARG